MIKFLFSESEVVYQKNKSKGLIDFPTYTPKPKSKKKFIKISIVKNPKKPSYTNCKNCDDPLNKMSQKLGLCPCCENK